MGAGPVADTVGGDGAGDGGDGNAVGVVANHQPVLGQDSLEVAQNDAGLDAGGQAVGVHLEDSVHALHVQHKAAVGRNHCAHDARAAAVGYDGNPVFVGPAHYVGDLGGTTGPHHHVGQPLERISSPEGAAGRQRVAGVAVEGVGVGQHVLRPHDAG